MDDSTPGELKDDAKVVVSWMASHPRVTWLVIGVILGAVLVSVVSCANTSGHFGAVGAYKDPRK